MKHIHKAMLLASIAVASSAALAQPKASPQAVSLDAPAGKCDRAAIQAMVGADAIIDSAAPTAQPAPHCRIEGHVITTNPGPNTVRFRLQLPDHGFNGRYLFAGLGGAAGYVPSDLELPRGNPVIKGFAMAGTDTGHSSEPLDWSFMQGNPAATLDYNHRGGHVATVAAQAVTRGYYGINKLWRYHSGCSGGGRMGVAALEHHPEDYDGILIGAPGRSTATMLMFMWATQQEAREPGAWLSPAKLAITEQHIIAQCDALDGAKDGIVSDPQACHFRPQTLLCRPGQTDGCHQRHKRQHCSHGSAPIIPIMSHQQKHARTDERRPENSKDQQRQFLPAVDRDWAVVLSEFLGHICRYNAVPDQARQLRLQPLQMFIVHGFPPELICKIGWKTIGQKLNCRGWGSSNKVVWANEPKSLICTAASDNEKRLLAIN